MIQGLIPIWVKRFFLLRKTSRRTLRALQSAVQWVLGVKHMVHESATHVSAMVNCEWSYTPYSLYCAQGPLSVLFWNCILKLTVSGSSSGGTSRLEISSYLVHMKVKIEPISKM